MQPLGRDSQSFENNITEEMFAKTHGILELDLSGSHDMSIVQTGRVNVECTLAELLEASIALISLNQFETYGEITPDGSVLLDLAP